VDCGRRFPCLGESELVSQNLFGRRMGGPDLAMAEEMSAAESLCHPLGTRTRVSGLGVHSVRRFGRISCEPNALSGWCHEGLWTKGWDQCR